MKISYIDNQSLPSSYKVASQEKVIRREEQEIKGEGSFSKTNNISSARKENPWLKKAQLSEHQEQDARGFDWKAAVYGQIEPEKLKQEMGENTYKQYMQTLDNYSEGLPNSKKVDKFI
ncbi:hypothetical protein Trichorick_01749 (plasmid) [Candidatus Trichorickettsia mobilis]|jgi:hypothetical protein|uniref:hypothetical protein n=1 Tax=Candidatus Trichorickettsia mobilis TaxID=1346319 RepID=UPI002B25FAE2|nr:hypothetical protein [Candidatus Trichorickettsia mobilis]WPY01826.1 hypothetical protein Trichorick_01749 [Candidatus Trichorickettsia mobilis]